MNSAAHQRGYSLIIAVGIIALLTLTGAVVLEAVYTDVQLSGADRAAQNALYVAEAGAVWGRQSLSNLLYPLGSAPAAAPLLSALTALPQLAATDALCPENACVAPPCPAPIACSSWYLLTPTAWVAYGDGQYRVAASCAPSCLVASPQLIVRSLGRIQSDGSQRLLEMTLGPQ